MKSTFRSFKDEENFPARSASGHDAMTANITESLSATQLKRSVLLVMSAGSYQSSNWDYQTPSKKQILVTAHISHLQTAHCRRRALADRASSSRGASGCLETGRTHVIISRSSAQHPAQ